ncbi:TonB-dependent receptor domain-containing protein [Terricaulis silvestris]|uniref:Outer membrane cobalamin translocator n=1 Tax=Terricaulis silvestris TaxID=2686094 RepID=A0A6I6MIU0_9CAUL|nr:TonB-dependent receptor [Terricaulis silvestris]QGZ95000.1 Outer membrane cobalamin translocator [Terricaulis silvestris]
MRNILKAALFAATAFITSPAFAQETDIVVTATREPTEASRLPARIEVVDRADIEARGLVTLVDALGAQAVQSGGAGQQTSVFLRGTNSKHVLALFDGIRLNDASSPSSAYDFGQDALGALERVEVLRGPASAIYGSDAVGGVVNMITRRGGETPFEPFLEAEIGSFGTFRTLLGAAGGGSATSYGVSVEFYDTEGFDNVPERFPLSTGDKDGSTLSTFTGTARHEAGNWGFDVLARYRESVSEYDTLGGGPGFDQRADDPDLGNEQEQTVWRLGGDYTLSDAFNVRLSGGEVSLDRAERDGGLQTFSAAFDRQFADLTAHYDLTGGSLNGGLSFENNTIDNVSQFNDPLTTDEDQSAAFVIGQFDIGERVVATGSVRVDDYEAFGAQATYSLGAVATFDAFRLFASFGAGFKAPSLSERYETGFFNIGNPDLAPEESESWEIGWDFDVSEAISTGASYYQTRIDNMINYSFGDLQNINIDEAEIDGAEFYVDVDVLPWANVRVDYAWTDAQDGATGVQLSRRPEHGAKLETTFRPADRLSVAVNWRYVGARNDTVYTPTGVFAGTAEVDSYSVGGGNVTFDLDDHAELFVRVDNITDEDYEPVEAYAGAPRSGFIGVRARF